MWHVGLWGRECVQPRSRDARPVFQGRLMTSPDVLPEIIVEIFVGNGSKKDNTYLVFVETPKS